MCWNDEDYPTLLKEMPDPPPVLFIRGDRNLLDSLQVAMVGTRNPSPMAMKTARAFAKSFADFGLTVTSGLALGVDQAAHKGALDSTGKTIAVAATGLDRVYPASHKALAEEIIKTGALVSEFPIGTQPKPGYFPRRNRIISGLSLGVLVVEAAIKSGTLVTAKHAVEQGREVFAIPGSIHNPLAKGCHHLIRQGAKLVETADDVLEELGHLSRAAVSEESEQNKAITDSDLSIEGDYAALLDKMGFDPTSVDELIAETHFTAEEISSMLLVMELEGLVSSAPGGLFYRCSTK
jgi:DNA protecting protein DprA